MQINSDVWPFHVRFYFCLKLKKKWRLRFYCGIRRTLLLDIAGFVSFKRATYNKCHSHSILSTRVSQLKFNKGFFTFKLRFVLIKIRTIIGWVRKIRNVHVILQVKFGHVYYYKKRSMIWNTLKFKINHFINNALS